MAQIRGQKTIYLVSNLVCQMASRESYAQDSERISIIVIDGLLGIL